MIEIKVDAPGLTRGLERLARGMANRTPMMAIISEDMLDAVKKNFAAQGRPAWQGLKPPVSKRRAGGMILQDTRQLANSIVPTHDNNSAVVGTNKVYAAIHQFGGRAGRGRKAKIPARPFLKLIDQDEARIEQSMSDYLASLIGA